MVASVEDDGTDDAPNTLPALARLAVPIVGVYLSEMAFSLTDALFVGHLGGAKLAAVGLTSGVYFTAIFAGMGMFSVLSIYVPEAIAGNRVAEVAKILRHGILLGLLVALVMLGLCYTLPFFFAMSGQDPEIVALSARYLSALKWSVFPIIFFSIARNYLSSVSSTQVVNWIMACAIGCNALLCYVLVDGLWIIPSLGVAGAGWATAGTNLFMATAIAAHVLRSELRIAHRLLSAPFTLDFPLLRKMLAVGLPIAGMSLVESGMFTAVSILAGLYGVEFLAANQIAILLSDIGIALAFGIGDAATVCVAHGLGRNDVAAIRRIGWGAVGLAAGLMLIFAAVVALQRTWIVGIFLDVGNAETAAIMSVAMNLLLIMAVFQLADGTQAVLSRLLRGVQDTLYPMWISIMAYWLIGIGGGWALASFSDLGGLGLWIGMAAGLSAASLILADRFRRQLRRLELRPATAADGTVLRE